MPHIVSNTTGLLHLIFALIALIAGTLVITKTKGTVIHKRIGYLYAVSMTLMLVTSFMIYNLYGRFAIFHWMAVVSTLTLIGGMIPMYLKKPATTYLNFHFSFMYWSVMGLYAAFVAEVSVRIPKYIFENGAPNSTFYAMVGVAIFLVMGLANYFFMRYKKRWEGFATAAKTN